MKISTSTLLALLLALPMVCSAQSNEDIDASTETSHDGLVQVRRAGFRNVWVKPGVDISAYTKIMPGPAQFHYRDVAPGNPPTRLMSRGLDRWVESGGVVE